MPKPVALIILNWNTPDYTSNCISSLLTYGDTALFDIVVADNGSTDGSLAILKEKFPSLIYLDNQQNLGFAEGNNRAIALSIAKGYTYSLILNNDTEVDEDIVKGLLEHLERHPKAAAVQPAIYWLHNKAEIWNGEGGYLAALGRVFSDKSKPGTTAVYSQAKWLTGCCMLVRNSVLQEEGAFNRTFFLYDEDVELSFRMRAAGYQLHYLPTIKLYHEAGASGQLKTKDREGTLSPVIHYYINRNRIWLLRRYASTFAYPGIFLYYTPYYLAMLFYFLLRGRTKKAGHLLNGLKAGFFTPEKVIWPNIKKDDK